MDVFEIVALLRRRWGVITVVCLCAIGLAYGLEKSDPGYRETGTVAIAAPVYANNMFAYATSLRTAEDLLNHYVASPAGEQQIRAAGGTANYDITMANAYNMEYPTYKNPYLDISVTSPAPAETADTFAAVIAVLKKKLATLQSSQGVPPDLQVRATLAYNSGKPAYQRGSRVRSLSALAIITMIIALLSAYAFDRRSARTSVTRSRAPRPTSRQVFE